MLGVKNILLTLYISIYYVLSVSKAAIQPSAARALHSINQFIIIIIIIIIIINTIYNSAFSTLREIVYFLRLKDIPLQSFIEQ